MLRPVPAPQRPEGSLAADVPDPAEDAPHDLRAAAGRRLAYAHGDLVPTTGRDRRVGLAMKRGIDLAGASCGLVALSPLLGAVSVALLISDGRPILFRQVRAGMAGRPFRIVKFRTMQRDADRLRADLRRGNEVAGNAAFKLTNDPRVTRLGRFLRRTSIDELPQLWNVLRGDMSLVGPRPHPFDDVAGYADWHFQRLTMKPGLTGAWQISARTDPDFDHWVEQDLAYIREWSPWLDIRIILATIPALLRAEGR
jgi:lipopolysaccharide/colanic/teichoic acid biosynthesis glycosyltransferase